MGFSSNAKPTPANYRRRIDAAIEGLADAARIANQRGDQLLFTDVCQAFEAAKRLRGRLDNA